MRNRWAIRMWWVHQGPIDSFHSTIYCWIFFRNSQTSLCHIHGTGSLWFRKIRLMRRARMIHFMDMAIVREGGPTVLASDVLRECCYMRGLNASNLGNDELVHWLDQWIQVSKLIDPKNFSLLLHLPVLIAYNHPNNWKLLYRDRPVAWATHTIGRCGASNFTRPKLFIEMETNHKMKLTFCHFQFFIFIFSIFFFRKNKWPKWQIFVLSLLFN